jgi:DNA-binding transcriptional MerR regulator
MVGVNDTDDTLLEIGRFSALSGLTVAALRHYDGVGLLEPAEVDSRTSYRRYRRDQLGAARQICELRGVDLPVEEVRAVLEATDTEAVRDVLVHHQARLTARARTLERMIDTADTFLERGVPPAPTAEPRPVQVMLACRDRDAMVAFYTAVFGWTFLPEIDSFSVGAFHTPSFFLITVENWMDGAPACFGVLVSDVDDAHAKALAAGATEVDAPADYAWKPRCSVVDDPSGNRIQLAQG